ncbi:MAG: RIP metalloprotease RseP [Rhodospirillaceae bacterium]
MIEQIMGLLPTILGFLVALSIVVFVHEMGHFLVGRWNGVKVEAFSLGFGKELFGFEDKYGTRWKFCLLPLGGYVKFYGDNDAASTPGEEVKEMTPEQKAVSFHHKSLGQRFAIVFAGPAANYIFAALVFAGLFMTSGQPTTPAVIGSVVPESMAERAGFQPGDRFLAVDGREIDNFFDLRRKVSLGDGSPMVFTFERDGAVQEVTVAPEVKAGTEETGGAQTAQLGVRAAASTLIGHVVPESVAEQAGMLEDDRILTVAGQDVTSFEQVLALVRLDLEQPQAISILVQRGEGVQELRFSVPGDEYADDNALAEAIGAFPKTERRVLGPVAALGAGAHETWKLTLDTVTFIKQIVVGTRPSSELGGPIRIAYFSGKALELGFVVFITTMALISVNLGFINLLPIPILDGGHLMFYTLEAIRGKPLSERTQEYSFRVGLMLVLGLMVFATWNDLHFPFM